MFSYLFDIMKLSLERRDREKDRVCNYVQIGSIDEMEEQEVGGGIR